ncbi:hypothetical protein [Streptomyces sp. UNOB3_S3]|uniref:hypothetical protein n=1 Tax=Streptomyces sp. UNOB3_S3 TaxID=2871682 RepID=UPI001E36BD1B|nr:hypothetical protein [Streptomyces sp. UNOB3_S3]MCC3775011.1 hypothetical protein [Streptomyces sp. UNOB3_S3]
MVRRRIRTALLSTAVTGSALAVAPLTATAAYADDVRVTYTCSSVITPTPTDSLMEIGITAPAVVRRGQDIDLKVTLHTLHGTIADRPPFDIKGWADVTVGGAGRGSVRAQGLTNTTPVHKGQEVRLTEGKATVKARHTGRYTFAPGAEVYVNTSDHSVTCKRKGGPTVAATTRVLPRRGEADGLRDTGPR